MRMALLWRTLVVAVALAAASAIGWWAVPVAAAAFGALTWRDRGGPVVAGFAGMLAWTAILAYDATRGPVGTVATTLGGVLQIRPCAVYMLTLAFAGLLSVCSAIVARAVVRAAIGPRRSPVSA
jgi:hypothetical protein